LGQNVTGLKHGLAERLGIDPERIRVVSPFIGGAFGSRGSLTQRTALIAIAARGLNRPVKLVATRDQGFTIASYRAETRHHVRLAADRDGKLVAMIHEGEEVTSRPDNYKVAGTDASTRLYACPNIASKVWSTPTGTRRASCARHPRCRICSRSNRRWTSWRLR
jgi:xanthine dehydrogenase YagR molybdenum-binding subunit